MSSSVSDRAVQSYRSVEVETQYVEVGDVRYAYRELGPERPADTTPLVFLHRFRGTLDDWDPAFVDTVAEHRHVILFSDAAVGSSTGSPATSVDQKAQNAASFVRALGHGVVDVLGFSMGGFVAQAIAVQEPALVRKVVLIGSGPGGNPETDPHTDIVFEIALKPEYAFEDVRYLFFAEGRETETQAYIERNSLRTDREPVVTAETIQAMAGLIMDFMGGKTGHYSTLAELRQPTLIINGDDDHFFPVKNQWLLLRELPDAQLAIYPQAGHAPHQQHPEAVAAQVNRFLESRDLEASR
ncbi:pimeloyl-ACP methyl ester carboxylesterase [Kribbella sp. VKM Ac-2527]|uniref:Pimeloyl-ACP methyl ester carboxylesterase n=1 Tax=Kribbella caucasensis TaxID=2512215 RepID=A0A4V3CAQ7_9ACTN|nr:alpha/beta hydrolase [Kribbella sp. VKM Ac-2527]TDO51792.1 pimeloyl-ACP methyl ester carboxylesterase [Kribbella sp. VKM Ac-2527]